MRNWTTIREVMWTPWDGPGLEHLRLDSRGGSTSADGVHGDYAFRVQYRIRCDGSWCVREVRVTIVGLGLPDLHPRADGQGHWTGDGGQPLPALDGCIGVDLSATAFTNALPIRRLRLQPGQSAELAVAYIDVPALDVLRVWQRYDCLTCGPDGGLYRYESLPYEALPTGFTAELPVDPDGLVIDYPQLFRRVWAS